MEQLRKKIYFATIPMQPLESLPRIGYRKEDKGELFSRPSRFPAIPMIDGSLRGAEDVKLVTVRTDDDAGRTATNYALFLEELAELSKELERELNVGAEIIIPHSENRKKQISFLKEICGQYEQNADVYMDITYGTKVTSTAMFSSLVFAEKLCGCNIRSVTYGKYAHDGGNCGELYDVRPLYEMAMLINAANYLEEDQVRGLLESLWGQNDG